MISKLPNVGTTIFTVMSALAAEKGAINLGQGFPDYDMSRDLIDRVHDAMRDGYNQYVHMNGFPPLLKELATKAGKLYGAELNAKEEITVTPGGTYALYTAMTTILQPGDEVILFEPAYDCYLPTIQLNGAVPVPIELKFPEYSIDWEEVRRKVNGKTKAIIINSPHNPTGAVLDAEDIEQLRRTVEGTEMYIISDEVYEHLIFDGKQHESILRYPDLFARSFVTFSFGKVYHCTGWKLGYCMAPAHLMAEFRKIHQFNCFTCDTPKQVALAGYLKNEDAYLHLGPLLQKKRDFFLEQMKGSRFKALPSHGSYFQIYSYADISDQDEKEFAIRLTEEAGVAAIPVSAFYSQPVNNQVLRFCFAKKEDTLKLAAQQLVNRLSVTPS